MKPINFTLVLAVCLMMFTYLCTVHANAAENPESAKIEHKIPDL